jgi:hypothetical protein
LAVFERERVRRFVRDLEVLLARDEEGRGRSEFSEGLGALWRDTERLRGEVEGFVQVQRKRLGRGMLE